MEEIDTIIQSIEDIEFMLKLREAYPQVKYNLMRNCNLAQLRRLSANYWALDYSDLGILLDDLREKYVNIVNVEKLIKDINPSKQP